MVNYLPIITYRSGSVGKVGITYEFYLHKAKKFCTGYFVCKIRMYYWCIRTKTFAKDIACT